MERRAHEHVEPGGEPYLKWARGRLAALAGRRKDLGLPSLQKHFTLDSGTRISLLSSEFGDSLRVFHTSGFYTALVNADNAVFEVPSSLLDGSVVDRGLVLPKDFEKLPGAFQEGTLDSSRTPSYRGMIVNHAFRAQHPDKYSSFAECMTPSGINLHPGAFRYFPTLGGGTALITSYHGGTTSLGDIGWAFVWISGMNSNANANLTVAITTVTPLFISGDFFYFYPDLFAVAGDGSVILARTRISGITLEYVGELLIYRPDGTSAILLSQSLGFDASVGGSGGGGFTHPATQSGEHFVANMTQNSATEGTVTLQSTGGFSATASVTAEIPVLFAGFGASVLGTRVKRYTDGAGATQQGYMVPIQRIVIDGLGNQVWELDVVTHEGTYMITTAPINVGHTERDSEYEMDISPSGKPAIATFGYSGFAAATVRIGSSSPVAIGIGRPWGRWTPDGRYFFVGNLGTLRIYSSTGTLLHSGLSIPAIPTSNQLYGLMVEGSSSVAADGTVTGRYTIRSIVAAGVLSHTFSLSVTSGGVATREATFGETTTSIGAVFIDDTRRVYP